MGSLSLSSAVGGLGEGLMEGAKLRNQNQQRDLDRMHLDRLQEVRNEAAMSRQEQGQEFTEGMADTAREQQLTDIESDREHAAGLLEGEREYTAEVAGATATREDVVRGSEQFHEVFIQWMKGEQEKTKDGSYTTKDGKWEMKIYAKGEEGPSGLPLEVETFVVHQPGSPFAFVQHGMHMLPHNYTPEEEEAALSAANDKNPNMVQARETLIKKAGTKDDDSSVFMDAYGFLPMAYFEKLRTEGQSGYDFQSFNRQFRGTGAAPTAEAPTVTKSPAELPALPTTEPVAPAPGGAITEGATAAASTEPPTEKEAKDFITMVESRANRKYLFSSSRAGRNPIIDWLQDMAAEKPWITDALARFRVGLPLTQEQVAKLAGAMDEQLAAR